MYSLGYSLSELYTVVHKRLDGPNCDGPSSELLATASLGVRAAERNF
jgi:hypothetical protein